MPVFKLAFSTSYLYLSSPTYFCFDLVSIGLSQLLFAGSRDENVTVCFQNTALQYLCFREAHDCPMLLLEGSKTEGF